MTLNRSKLAEPAQTGGALIVDFEAAKARRQELRLEAAAHRAAVALARCEAGHDDWRALMAALVAPFNP